MLGELSDFRLEKWFSRWEFATEYSFTASDAQTMSVVELLALAGSSLDELGSLDLGYRPTYGTHALRSTISGLYDTVEMDDVLAFAGAQEALFWVLVELLRDGGHAIVTVPNYQSIESIPLATSADVSGLPLWVGEGADLRWTLDLDLFQKLIRSDTRVVVVNFPNNPTGFVPDRTSFVAFAEICHDRGIVLVSDEVFRGIEVDPERTLPHAADLSPTAVSVNVLSKSYGLPGLRIGWVATRDRRLLDRLERRKHYTSICNSGLTEHLATVALGVGDQLQERNRAIVAENTILVRDFFAEYPELFAFEAPMGGCVAFPRYLGADGPEAFSARAIQEAGILTLPASLYASELAEVPMDRIRIGFGRANTVSTLHALRSHLSGGLRT